MDGKSDNGLYLALAADIHEVFVEDKIEKGNTLQTAASQPHGGIALYRDILANVLIPDGKVSDNPQGSQGKGEKVAENQDPNDMQDYACISKSCAS